MMGDITYSNISVVLPELYLCITAMALLMYGVYRRIPAYPFMWFGLIAFAFTAYLAVCRHTGDATILNGMFVVSDFTIYAKLLILSAAGLVLALSSEWLFNRARPFEFVILMMLAVLGMMLMVSAGDLLALYMA